MAEATDFPTPAGQRENRQSEKAARRHQASRPGIEDHDSRSALADSERVLEVAGLTELEERVYIDLLSRHGQSATDVADRHRVPDRRARETLVSLEDNGLVSRSATKPPRYVPAAPDAALEMLLLRRREKLERARLAIERLSELYRGGAPADPLARDLVQLISGHDAVEQRMAQVLWTATEEILGLGKAPLATPSREHTELKVGLLRRGVRSRAVYEIAALDALPEFLSQVGPAGEESRAVPVLPMRLIVVDRRVGLTPLHADRWDQWLVVTSPPLLEALLTVFDVMWERGTPVTVSGEVEERAAGIPERPELPADAQRVLVLLASGLRDRSIADQLGMNVRTVERHVTRVMEHLSASTRFEAGVLAARTGLLDTPIRGARARRRSSAISS